MSVSVYEIVTNKIIEKLEKGTVPWRRPWKVGSLNSAVNWTNGKYYRGINTLLLEPGEYATFKQIQDAGGKVKKGAQSQMVVFWKWAEKENENGETEKIPCLRYYNVFEINSQVDGLESKWNIQSESYEHEPVEIAENLVKDFMNRPDIRYAPGRAYYSPSMDYISVPPLKDYPNGHEYYSTMFHELVHSTGHSSRLNREGITKHNVKFGDTTYSKEELVAELGAAMLCAVSGIDNSTIDNSASYINSWLTKLRSDKKFLVYAASQAQKAADYIQNKKATYSEE